MIKKICRFIKKLIAYTPILWKDEDWDYGYIYTIIEFKLQRLYNVLVQDELHTNSNRYARQVKICLAYLRRYLYWTDYIEYPIDDIKFEPSSDSLVKLTYTSSINEAKRKQAIGYEDFNREMFWKRFLQWHRNWWV